jgi:SAM-dependent methyltransferase
MSSLLIPTVPNSPLSSRDAKGAYGKLRLRRNRLLDFMENCEFDPALAIYDDHYQNSQAYSSYFSNHMKNVLGNLKKRFPAGTSVVEVGCGKGDFIGLLEEDGHFEATGYDATYEGDNPRIHKRYLSDSDRMKAGVVVARHVLEHIPQPHQFLRVLRNIFGAAKIYIEVPNLDWILTNEAFFDITYEHVNYFSRAALAKLFSNRQVESGLCFGGQYQYLIAGLGDLSDAFVAAYNSDRWDPIDFYELFPSLPEKINKIHKLLAGNRRAYIWGAATKGCMFLAHCARLKKVVDQIEFCIDINPNKCGRFLPGSLVLIKSKVEFFQSASEQDLLLVANPNYLPEILDEIKATRLKTIEVICL